MVAPAADEAAARAVLERVAAEHPDATHHCWAWRLAPAGPGAAGGVLERAADAGEPSGTAGQPILRALAGAELVGVMAVVVRWFGGTKLGKGGLARAYAGATRAALAELPVELRVPTVQLTVELPYDRLGAVKRLLRPPAVELVGESYGEHVRLELAVHASEREAFEAALADLRLVAEPARVDA